MLDALRHMTGAMHACIDAVGLEAHGTTLDAWYDRAKASMFLAPIPLHFGKPSARVGRAERCRFGVYGGWLDKFPIGAAFAKG